MKLVFIADIHIKLGQKNVPKNWQLNRLDMLARKLCEIEGTDTIIIGGDLLDTAKPTYEEIAAMLQFFSTLSESKYKSIILIPGNHEMVNKKVDCYAPFRELLFRHYNCTVIDSFRTLDFDGMGIDFIPYNILHKFKASDRVSDYAVTHVRGEIPPHVLPEVDLQVFEGYKEVYAGDLHSYQNSQKNIKYPGSPYYTSFHRDIHSNTNGIFIINTDTTTSTWVDLGLPQLVRKKISSPEEIIATDYHHTVYEIEGDLHDISKIEKTDLLDKKIVKDTFAPATLDMESTTIEEELVMYLNRVKNLKDKVTRLVSRYKEVENENNNT